MQLHVPPYLYELVQVKLLYNSLPVSVLYTKSGVSLFILITLYSLSFINAQSAMPPLYHLSNFIFLISTI
nr:MAG TPA: hypothetical protein [Caudoviricetes sp.]